MLEGAARVLRGSGFVVDRGGYILTNAHVIDGASQVTVSFEDKKTENAKVVGKDSSTDLALLKIDPSGITLRPLQLGDSSHVQVGDHAIMGGLTAVHQFCRLGRYAITGGCSKIVQDVPPFMIAIN